MAVMIKMDMPAACRFYPMYSKGVCKLGLIAITNEAERSPFCTLVEIPEAKRIMPREALEAAGFET